MASPDHGIVVVVVGKLVRLEPIAREKEFGVQFVGKSQLSAGAGAGAGAGMEIERDASF